MGGMVEGSRTALVAPLVPLAIAVAAGLATDRFVNPWGAPTWGAIALVSASAFGVAAWRRSVVEMLALLTIALALGGGWHQACWSGLDADDLARSVGEIPRPAWVRGVLHDVSGVHPGVHPGDPGVTRAVLDVTRVCDEGTWRSASGRVQLLIIGSRADLIAGEAVEAAGSLARVAGPLNPGEFDTRESLRAQGVRLRMVIDDPRGIWLDPAAPSWPGTHLLGTLRAWSRAKLVAGLDPSVAPLAAALLLGQREGVEPDVNDAFARTGTTHLLAISGLHLQALALVLFFVFRALGLGRRGAFAAVALATIAYALLVGLVPSVVRSAAMTVIGCAAGIFDRSARPANTLASAALVTLGLNPANLFDVGCQLSFLAIAAIVWGSTPLFAWWTTPASPLDRLERSLEPRWRKRARVGWRWLAQMVVVSLVVWLVTLPLVTFRFHIASPIGVVLNVPLIPLTTVALLASGLTLGLSALWAPLGVPSARLSEFCLTLTDLLVRWGASRRWGHCFVPSPSRTWVLGVYALLGLATAAQMGRWPRPIRRGAWAALGVWIAVGLVLSVARFPRPSAPLEAEILAVGHGLSVLIETEDGRVWVYDCGRMRDPGVGRRIIAPALWARGVRRIDAIVLSHADADHYNGLPDLLDRFSVGVVRVPPGFAGPTNPGAVRLLDEVRARGVPIRSIADGDHWEASGATFTVRHPPPDNGPVAFRSSDNARSVVLDIERSGRHLWLTGDLEADGLVTLKGRPLPPPDVMLAPNHFCGPV